MKRSTWILACLAVGLLSAAALGQGKDIVIQQPTGSFNTVTTTVTAPDGGTMLLGGINRASQGRTERGVPILGKLPYLGRLFGNRGIGQDFSSSSMTVSPRIIILEEEEEKLGLGQFGTGTGAGGGILGAAGGGYQSPASFQLPQRPLTETDRRALELSQHITRNAPQPVVFEEPQQVGPSPEEIRRRNELAAQRRGSEANTFFDKGKNAEAAGKSNVAKIYYKMAARRANGELKDHILRRLNEIDGQQ